MEISEGVAKLTYSEAINELERIVNAMQTPDCDIDKLADYTNRALQLMQHCRAKLTDTEEKINSALSQISSTL